jgi:hypothetical protein
MCEEEKGNEREGLKNLFFAKKFKKPAMVKPFDDGIEDPGGQGNLKKRHLVDFKVFGADIHIKKVSPDEPNNEKT